ncbi:T9SS type A sorting domain-containing protein [Flavivirga sp. 57AJ16]|uniref:T9SS type A sorting domain-containing protein n=1 Tax=Flavivirga sp. 57AJ16 TaxID=3025307 RepID=UPI002366F4DB|nr:T9SS type A sorting domain-containing protein [Flavivirga sp. 57AJ16]MDD7887732.1 T9SS type A sorting domain-containing protein [Flavivirga sp. 57AJ16]
MKQIYILFIAIFTLGHSHAQVEDLLGGADYANLSNWYNISGDFTSSGGIISTEGASTDSSFGFIDFTRAIGAGDVLEVSFSSNTVANFATNGWCGMSLFDADDERLFIGSPWNVTNWGAEGAALGSSFHFAETSPVATVVFTYNYDTGAWSLDINGEVQSGTTTGAYAFETLRISAGNNGGDVTDIAVSNLVVQEISNTLSASNFDFSGVKVYPNPTTDYVKVTGLKNDFEYAVYNVLGSKILEGVVSANNDTVDTKNLMNGLYYMVFEGEKTVKLVKNN